MPAFSPSDWFRYLATDGEIVGIVTWIGLAVTIGGFAVALAQIRKIKKSSEASRQAVVQLAGIVRSQEQATKIAEALGHLRMAQAMVKLSNTEAAMAYLSVVWSLLISTRELETDETDRRLMDGWLNISKKLRDDLGMPSPARADSRRAINQRYAQIGELTDSLATLSARLHMRLSGIGAQP